MWYSRCGGHRRYRYQNKAVIYDLLFKASAETLTTIAADPKHLGAASASLQSSIPGVRR